MPMVVIFAVPVMGPSTESEGAVALIVDGPPTRHASGEALTVCALLDGCHARGQELPMLLGGEICVLLSVKSPVAVNC